MTSHRKLGPFHPGSLRLLQPITWLPGFAGPYSSVIGSSGLLLSLCSVCS